jgi:nucleoside-diphosphate-sugar epimerase
MRVLVTGAAGRIGSVVCTALARDGLTVLSGGSANRDNWWDLAPGFALPPFPSPTAEEAP